MLLILASLGWCGYGQYAKRIAPLPAQTEVSESVVFPPTVSVEASVPLVLSFKCDGRQHCSQMKSCKEAKYFLANCPGVNMDGDHDGVPCEEQWCTTPFAD